MPDQTLLTLFDEVRGKTLWLLEMPPPEARWTPPGTCNHALWHAGHIFCVVERLVRVALRGQVFMPPEIPAGWWDLFGWDSNPRAVAEEQWPPLPVVTDHLRQQHVRLSAVLAELTQDQLSAEMNLPAWGWHGNPVRYAVIHAFHDEANHGGEIWLLRKLFPLHGAM